MSNLWPNFRLFLSCQNFRLLRFFLGPGRLELSKAYAWIRRKFFCAKIARNHSFATLELGTLSARLFTLELSSARRCSTCRNSY